MDLISELEKSLNVYFEWNKARMTCFVKMLLALLATRTVNLNKIACSMLGEVEQSSKYRQLQRFFAQMAIDFDKVAGFIFQLFFISGGKWYLTLDRTNWQWGKSDINILTLAIAFKGIAIPIYWELLDKKGNSHTAERIALLQKFINRFGKECVAGLLADREFIGEDWFEWLLTEKISFYIRIKKNLLTTNSRGAPAHVKELFYGLRRNEERVLYGKRSILGHYLYVAGLKLVDGELLIIVTDQSPGDAIKIYAFRWEIETLFSCLKGRGFNFEDTHIIDPLRIKKLFVALAIAFCWAHKTGEFKHEARPIKIKTHGRMAVSFFRYGLDHLINALVNLATNASLFANCVGRLIPVKPIPTHWEYCL